MIQIDFTKRHLVRGTAVALLLASGACGNFTAGGVTGEARVVLSGDAPVSTPASHGATPPVANWAASSLPARQSGDDHPEGEVEAQFRMYLIREDGGLVGLTDQDIRVAVDLEGIEEPQVASRVVDAVAYTGFRIVFDEIEVEVDAGLVINGDTITGPIDIELEGPDLTVDRPVTLNIGDGETVELLVDLNAADWLQAVDPVALTVSAAAFASFIDVSVR